MIFKYLVCAVAFGLFALLHATKTTVEVQSVETLTSLESFTAIGNNSDPMTQISF